MTDSIDTFLTSKNLSTNSALSYRYDLQQFMDICQGEVTEMSLARYQAMLQTLKPSAQKRKISAVNQFLYFLYETARLERYHRLQLQVPVQSKPTYQLLDLSALYEETPYHTGQLIALCMVELGLLPKEIAALKQADIDRDFRVVRIGQAGHTRILPLADSLLPFLDRIEPATYLFDKGGQSYSRQWFFTQLRQYVASLGQSTWTAQQLREQFILKELKAGRNLEQIAQHLGLKSPISLEKYKEWISN